MKGGKNSRLVLFEEAKQLEIAKEFLPFVPSLESIGEVRPRPLFKSLLSQFGIILRHFILSDRQTDRPTGGGRRGGGGIEESDEKKTKKTSVAASGLMT